MEDSIYLSFRPYTKMYRVTYLEDEVEVFDVEKHYKEDATVVDYNLRSVTGWKQLNLKHLFEPYEHYSFNSLIIEDGTELGLSDIPLHIQRQQDWVDPTSTIVKFYVSISKGFNGLNLSEENFNIYEKLQLDLKYNSVNDLIPELNSAFYNIYIFNEPLFIDEVNENRISLIYDKFEFNYENDVKVLITKEEEGVFLEHIKN